MAGATAALANHSQSCGLFAHALIGPPVTDLPPMAAGPERTVGTFRSVKLGGAKGKAEGRGGEDKNEGGEL